MEDKVSAAEKRQVEILKKYHEVDEENKIVKVELHYAKASDIICGELSSKEKPIFGAYIIENIHELLNRFPRKYTLDLSFSIGDYEEYSPHSLIDSLSDTLELEQYRTQRKVKRTWILALALLLIGVGMLVFLTVFKKLGIIGDVTLSDKVFDYVLDTAACVFIWECVSQLFIYPAEFVVTNTEVFHGFHAVSFNDNQGNVLSRITKAEICSKWVVDDKRQRLGKIFLICTGGLHCMLGVIALINFFIEIPNIPFNQPGTVASVIVLCAVSALQIIYGIGSISRFNGKGPFKRIVYLFSFLLFLGYIVTLILIIINAVQGTYLSATAIVSFVAGLIATSLNHLGCIWTSENYKHRHKNK